MGVLAYLRNSDLEELLHDKNDLYLEPVFQTSS